jgi:chaperonin GroES
MKVRPLHDYVLVKRESADDITRGGIHIPDTAKERPQRGEVLAIGPGRVNDAGVRLPLDVRVGDVVLFGKYISADAIARVDLEPESPVLIKATELLAVMVPE